jgi:hypothetical protein
VGYTQTRTFKLDPRVVPWLAPVSLVLIFLLLWPAWIIALPKAEIYQSGWGTGFGKVSSLLGTFYILFFIPAFLLAIASQVVPHLSVNLPPWAQQLWPHRAAILAGITFLSFMFLLLQLFVGFGIEEAAQGVAGTNSMQVPGFDLSVIMPSAGKEIYYMLRRTLWLDLVVVLQVVAIAGAALDYWLSRRPNRPLPKIEISW